MKKISIPIHINSIALLLVLNAFLFVSCEQEVKPASIREFPTTHELRARKIPINVTMNPVDLMQIDDFFIFMNEYISGEDCFYVFDKTMKFCYSFGRLGSGPKEFIAPRMVFGTGKKNHFSIFDSAPDKIFEYQINEESPIFISETKINDIVYPVQSISYINDSIVIYRINDNEGQTLFSYNTKSSDMVDTIKFSTAFKKLAGPKYKNQMDGFFCSEYDTTILITFNFADVFRIGAITPKGKFEISKEVDVELCQLNSFEDMKPNIVHYFFSQLSSKKIFAAYYGLPFQHMQPFPFNMGKRTFKMCIEVYDYEKSPIAKLNLDCDMLKFIVDEKNQKIYTWDFLKDFDYLLEYDISYLN